MCPLCNDVLEDPVLLPCGHSACEGCVFTGIEQDVICPVGCGIHKPDDVFPDDTKRKATEELRILCRWATLPSTDGAGLRFARDGCKAGSPGPSIALPFQLKCSCCFSPSLKLPPKTTNQKPLSS